MPDVRPELDKTFDCLINYQGLIAATIKLTGEPLNKSPIDGRITVKVSLQAHIPEQLFHLLPTIRDWVRYGRPVRVGLRAVAFSENERNNWVGWSKIGDIRFLQDLTADSGYRAMPWKGTVYNILKLGKNAVVYGNGGISLLRPVTDPLPTFGMRNILPFGIKNRTAVCGTENQHYFIDTKGCLWSLTEEGGTQKLGYEEFLFPLKNPVMHYDTKQERIIISDRYKGYILTKAGLGGGYRAITGFNYINGDLKVVSPDDYIQVESLQIVSDILDFSYRGLKTIEAVQIGTDVKRDLYAAIDYRYAKDEPFRTTQWVLVNKEGVAFIRTGGVEFRVRVRVATHTDLDIDYITLQYKRNDRRFVRGFLGGIPNDY